MLGKFGYEIVRFQNGSNKVAFEIRVVAILVWNHTCTLVWFWNHAYDFRANCPPLSSITIIYPIYYYNNNNNNSTLLPNEKFYNILYSTTHSKHIILNASNLLSSVGLFVFIFQLDSALEIFCFVLFFWLIILIFLSSRFLSRYSWRGRRLKQLSRMEIESE